MAILSEPLVYVGETLKGVLKVSGKRLFCGCFLLEKETLKQSTPSYPTLILSAGEDGVIRMFMESEGDGKDTRVGSSDAGERPRLVVEMCYHGDSIFSLNITCDGGAVVACSSDGCVSVTNADVLRSLACTLLSPRHPNFLMSYNLPSGTAAVSEVEDRNKQTKRSKDTRRSKEDWIHYGMTVPALLLNHPESCGASVPLKTVSQFLPVSDTPVIHNLVSSTTAPTTEGREGDG
jgi:WD40 repeat protein